MRPDGSRRSHRAGEWRQLFHHIGADVAQTGIPAEAPQTAFDAILIKPIQA
jgi:hypothetical protein